MDTIYRVREATTWRELDGEIVVLDSVDSVYYAIAGCGAALWPKLVAGASQHDLIDEIRSTFAEVPQGQASTDVQEFIESCLGNGLIEAATK
jgi:hypothetical protein